MAGNVPKKCGGVFLQRDVKAVMTLAPCFILLLSTVWTYLVLPYVLASLEQIHTPAHGEVSAKSVPLFSVAIVLSPFQYLGPFTHKDGKCINCPLKDVLTRPEKDYLGCVIRYCTWL